MPILDSIVGALSCPACESSNPPFNFKVEQRLTLRQPAGDAAPTADNLAVIELGNFYVCINCGHAIRVK